MKITVLHEGAEVDLDVEKHDTAADVIKKLLTIPDGEVPKGAELRHEGLALELGRKIDDGIEEGSMLTFHFNF